MVKKEMRFDSGSFSGHSRSLDYWFKSLNNFHLTFSALRIFIIVEIGEKLGCTDPIFRIIRYHESYNRLKSTSAPLTKNQLRKVICFKTKNCN